MHDIIYTHMDKAIEKKSDVVLSVKTAQICQTNIQFIILFLPLRQTFGSLLKWF